ncbi:hypothetical protein BD779DRAFT_1601708, partial [Infundibulicybe gibba]
MYEKIEQAHYKGEIAVTFIKLESKHEWRGGGGRSFSSPDSKTPNTLVLVVQNASNDLTRLDDMKINFTTLKHVGPIADPRTGQPCTPGSTPPLYVLLRTLSVLSSPAASPGTPSLWCQCRADGHAGPTFIRNYMQLWRVHRHM